MIDVKRGTEYYLAFPAIDAAFPDKYISGVVPVEEVYSKDGGGSWIPLLLSDSPTEIATSGMYEITIYDDELEHDQLLVKFAGTGMADDAFFFTTRTKTIDDLNDFDPANDIVALVERVNTVGVVESVLNVTSIYATEAQTCIVYDATQPYRDSVGKIIVSVRDALSDPNGERYSTDRLVRLVDKAQRDLNIRAKILRNKITLAIFSLQADFAMPVNTRNLSRVVGPSGPIPLKSHAQADEEFGLDWETETGIGVQAIVYDKMNTVGFKVYPIQELLTGDDETFDFIMSSDFGMLTQVEDITSNSDYGMVTDFSDVTNMADYGTITALVETFDEFLLTMYTWVDTETLTYVENGGVFTFSPMQLPQIYDTILEHYVIGVALRDDLDTQNRALGAEHLAMYGDLAGQAIADVSKNSMVGSASRTKPSSYNSAV